MLNDRNNSVWFCSTPFSMENEHVVDFASRSDQASYFLDISRPPLHNLSYVRNDVGGGRNYLSVELPFAEVVRYNYMMYKNGIDSRYYFAFITGVEYRNEKVTKVFVEYDVYQNWKFDVIYKSSFVERMSVGSDDHNTLADNVAHGQLVLKDHKSVIFRGGYFVFCSADPTQDVVTDSPPYAFNVGNYTIPAWTLYYDTFEASEMSKTLQRISAHGWGDRIMSCVYVPFVNPDIVIDAPPSTHPKVGLIRILQEIDKGYMSYQVEYNIPSATYKKMNTYPYSKIQIEDLTTGQTIDYSPEKFKDMVAKFEIRSTISERPTYRIIPMNYEGQFYAYDKAVVVQCDTTLATSNSLYAKYMMTNKEGNSLAKMGAVVSGAMSFASGVPSVALAGSISTYQSLASISNQESQASMLGNSVSMPSDSAQERVNRSIGFDINYYTVDDDHKRVCESHWKQFGYPVRSLAYPMSSYNNYFYVKLGTANIQGNNVPVEQLTKFKNLYIMGITHWKSVANYMNY